MQHAEPLLFIDDNQPEVFEQDVAAQEPVRSDDDVYAAFPQQLRDLLLFPRRPESREHLNGDGITRHAFAERIPMLFGQHRCRTQHSDLIAIHYRLERRADRHLRLAVPNIPADESVHRPTRFHVTLDFFDGGKLVGRLIINKRRLELVLPRRVRRKRVTFEYVARGLDLQQVRRQIHDRALGGKLLPLPECATELMQRRLAFPRANVF